MTDCSPPICGTGSARAQSEPGDDTRVRRPGQIDQLGDGVDSLLMRSAEEGHEPALRLGSRIAAVAAPDLAIDDRGPHPLLAPLLV